MLPGDPKYHNSALTTHGGTLFQKLPEFVTAATAATAYRKTMAVSEHSIAPVSAVRSRKPSHLATKVAPLLPPKASSTSPPGSRVTLVARVPPTSTRSSELRLLRIGSATVYVSINTEVSSTGSEQLVLANTYDSHYDTTLIGEDILIPTLGPTGHRTPEGGSPESGNDDNGNKSDNHSHQQRGMTAGITAGVIGACIVCGVFIFLVASRRRRKRKPHQNETAARSQGSLEFRCAGV